MKRAQSDYEHEIVNQIMNIELCLNICKQIPTPSGQGEDYKCYFFNLNIGKAIGTLHSLLNPTNKEISIQNYKLEYKNEISGKSGYEEFDKDTLTIEQGFKLKINNLRHKVISHLDPHYKHSNFVTGYLDPEIQDDLMLITKCLKFTFFNFTNYAQDNGNYRVLEQVQDFLDGMK